MSFDSKAFIATLTTAPGVYRMLAEDGGVLYVGKARDLKRRVGSYFQRPQMDPRIAAMLNKVASVEVTVTRTEGEALLLENELIKSLKPRYNILLRDSKSYPYIWLTSADEFPRLAFHRGARDKPGRYFGPFPSAFAVRESLARMYKLFRIRQCEDSYFKNRSRPCLQYQIGRCSAPCVGHIQKDDYARDVRHAELFLEGRSSAVLDELGREMDHAAESLEFERAAIVRDRIAALKATQARQYVAGAEEDADVLACVMREGKACVQALFFRNSMSLGARSFFPSVPTQADEAEVLAAFVGQYYLDRAPPSLVLVSHALADQALIQGMLTERRAAAVKILRPQRGERARLIEMALTNAETSLTAELSGQQTQAARWAALSALLCEGHAPKRVECFDISHTMGEATVASCVVFGPEGPIKSQYRRFNIRGVAPGDDYGAMDQALERRFRNANEADAVVPDLLLIDGGVGQLRAAEDVLARRQVSGVRVVGVAKGQGRKAGLEELVLGNNGRTLRPDAADPGLHMVQRIRDEAHRFAITGHRARRAKAREMSSLEEIAGIGSKRRAALLRHFGGWAGVSKAGVAELCQVPGINAELAQRIYATLHG